MSLGIYSFGFFLIFDLEARSLRFCYVGVRLDAVGGFFDVESRLREADIQAGTRIGFRTSSDPGRLALCLPSVFGVSRL